MGLLLSFYQCLHWIFQNLCFHWSRWWPEPLGLIAVVVHRDILNITNLYPANLPPPRDGDTVPLVDPTKRPGDGYGTDKYNPSAGATGSPMGRNCPAIPSKERSPQGDPDVQMVAQRLLSRDGFHPAGDQLNILAAAWIQAMVHDCTLQHRCVLLLLACASLQAEVRLAKNPGWFSSANTILTSFQSLLAAPSQGLGTMTARIPLNSTRAQLLVVQWPNSSSLKPK